MECPILVWMLSLNRDVTTEEYDKCYNLVRECAPHARIAYDCTPIESFPVFFLRLVRIPESTLIILPASSSHRHTQQSPDDMPSEKFLQSMIGYHLAYENSLCGMVMTQGRQLQVINIGLGIKQLCVEPRGVTVAAYAESVAHKLTPLEMTRPPPTKHPPLSLKAAYIKAVSGGFGWSRLQFNIPNESAWCDDHPLESWEFHVFKTQLGVQRGGTVIEESYQCACAFFRGTIESKFTWHDNAKDLEALVQFVNIDQMIKVIPKLTA
ncbi:hypothetical protein EV363DRAFT_1317387 [Boletus edulis]|nr:hypothetical protein EV363DRAFT_1317387 [Boletus edulis]